MVQILIIEPFHLDNNVLNETEKHIYTIDPYKNAPTKTWHAYVAKDKKDLYDMENAWHRDETDANESTDNLEETK